MKINSKDYKKISRTMKIRYIPAFLLIIILIITRQVIIDYQINQSKDTSQIVNIAGKQRMLSQMITKDTFILNHSDSDETTNYYLEEITKAVEEWKQSHIDLQYGNENKGIKVITSSEIQNIYEEIKPNHEQILESSYEIIRYIENGGIELHALNEIVTVIEENEVIFLEGMDKIVNLYEEYGDDKIEYIDNIEQILFWIIIVIILFVIFLIFVPSERMLKKSFEDMNEAYEGLHKIFKTVQNLLYLVNAETFNIIMMSEDGEKILNTPKEDFINLANSLEFASINKEAFINKIKTEEKISQMEIIINQNDETKFFLLSSTKVRYLGEESILISLFDITIQKNAENSMRNLSIRDKLTGLYNRYFLEEIIVEEMSRSLRYNFQFSVFILDLDFFKNINDTWGHPVGDIILKETADLASRSLRRSDFLIRIGGEEFLLLMPHTNLKEAMSVADKIRKEIESIDHPIVGKYTASFGVAQWDKSETFKELYERADEALYKAKEKGRNRVVSSKKRLHLKSDGVLLDWKQEWESGNSLIDRQHKELLDIANEFIFLSLPKSDAIEPIQKIDDLIKHITYHFECEEGILKRVSYLGYLDHSKIHEKIKKDIEELKVKYNKGDVKLSAFFTFMFDEVLIGHMLDEDIKFFDIVKDFEEENE